MIGPANSDVLSENKKKLLDLYRRGSRGGGTEGASGSAVRPAIAPRPSGDAVPLSPEQHLIWLHCQLAPALPLYNEMATIRRNGGLDAAALERSLQEIVRRHEAWRTRFRTVDDRPVQIVDPHFSPSLRVTDLSELPESEREAAALRLASEDVREPMDLATGPLLRAHLVRLSPADHRLFLTLHQIIQDGTSVYCVLLPELAALYDRFVRGEPPSLAEPPLQYPDYALRQAQEARLRDARSRSHAESLAYWRTQLSGWTPLELPTDEPRPHYQSFRGRQETFRLSARLTEALKRLAKRENVTLFVVLLGAFETLLHRYSGQDDILVGTVLSTRKRPDVEKLLGVFLNTVVLRTTVADELTFTQLLAALKEVTVQALSHGQLPYSDLLQELQPRRDPGRNPFFQTMFVFEPPRPEPPPGWDLTPMDVDAGTVRVDLHLQMDDRPEGVCAHLRYNADLWDASTIQRLIDHFQVLLESVVRDPHSTLSAIPILTPLERSGARAAEARPSNGFIRFESAAIEQSIAQRFARQVAVHGDRTAISEKTRWTYRELDGASDGVAWAVAASMTANPAPVALLLEQDAAMVAAILGVLKTPCPYVPLDPTHPIERLTTIAADAGARTVIVSRGNHRFVPELTRSGLVPRFLEELLEAPVAPYTGPAAASEDVAYILYTSGSTGTPKGVKQSHRNVLHFIGAYTNNLRICRDDRLTLLAPYGVDAAVMDIFGAVLNGAALHPVDVKNTGLPGVRERLLGDGITIFHSTPTLYRHLVRELVGHPNPETVRLVVLGGEEVRREDVDAFRERFAPHCLMVNGFGPTESTVTLQHFVDMGSQAERRSVPIGYPVERTSVSLLSRDGRPGQVYGEIAIRSAHVALGYWRNEELTQRAFVPARAGSDEGSGERVYKTGDMGRLLPDGRIEFRGRRDLQTKIQGFRVELGEVEAALLRHPGIKEAVATAWQPPGDEDKRLVAYFVASGPAVPTDDELRRFLRSKLPGPMIPSAFVHMDAVPITASGKLDRRALPEPPVLSVPSTLDGPRDSVEEHLVAIWASALRVGAVGIHDDFFALGGHSVIALKLMSDVYARFGVNLPLATLFESPTVELIADILRSAARDRDGSGVIAVQPAGKRTPLFCVQSQLDEAGFYGDLARHLGSEQPLFALPVSDVTASPSARGIPTVAAEVLEKIRSVQADGPYRLAGFGAGGVVAFEMAQQLVARFERVASLAVFWCASASSSAWAPHKPPIAKRVQDHFQRLRGLSMEEKLGYVIHEARASRAVSKGDYVARPYSGKMTLFLGGGASARALDPRHLDGMSAREIELIEVPGDRETMFREPFVAILAERLRDVLVRDGA